jgi:predicted nucleic acid-binding protein
MRGLFYWDTSTLVKLYAPEPDSPAYRALMQARPERPVTSFLHRVELFYALRQKEDRGEIVAGAAARLFAEYERHLGEGRFHEIPWGGDVSDAARTALDACLAAPFLVKLRSLDGLHLGAVISAGITLLVTTDSSMRRAAPCLGITLIDP